MNPNLIDRLCRRVGGWPPFVDTLNIFLYRAIGNDPAMVERWLWRREPHSKHPSNLKFNETLHRRAISQLSNESLPQDTLIERLRALVLIQRADIAPPQGQAEAAMVCLASVKAWGPLFWVARKVEITPRETTLVFAIMMGYMGNAEDDAASIKWLQSFRHDPLAREQFKDPTSRDGALFPAQDLAVSIAQRAFTHGSNELLLEIMKDRETWPAWTLKGLVGRSRPLSQEVVCRLTELRVSWVDALAEEHPDMLPLHRFIHLASLIKPSAGDLVSMIQTAQRMQQAQAQHEQLENSTQGIPPSEPAPSINLPRRRF